jgi:acylpyruvate hydrolase
MSWKEIWMKVVTFAVAGRDRVGAVVDEHVVDLNAAYAAALAATGDRESAHKADQALPAVMLAFIRGGDHAMVAAAEALRFAREHRFDVPGAVLPLERVRFRAPVPRPPKIICTGTNYEDYRQVIGLAKSAVPLIFLKAPSCVVGPGDPVQIPEGYGEVYHEYEFSCVIGKRCKGVRKEQVSEVIFGYTIFDDITGRSLEATSREYQPWGKSMDTYGPMGPWIVTPDEMPKDLYNLRILRRRNGKIEAESNTSNMIFRFDDIVAFASTFWTLEPGDLITTASPMAGPISPGDIIESEIEGIGVLRNPVESVKVDPTYAQRIGL